MESSGSLWKLIKREGLSYDGLFVVLQSAEIGEKISYLRSDLTMSPELSKAAVWMVKSLSASDYNEYTKPVFAYGALVQFELVCDDSSADSIHRALAYREKVNKMPFQPGQPRFEESLLVAASSSTGSGEKGIAILNQMREMLLWTISGHLLGRLHARTQTSKVSSFSKKCSRRPKISNPICAFMYILP